MNSLVLSCIAVLGAVVRPGLALSAAPQPQCWREPQALFHAQDPPTCLPPTQTSPLPKQKNEEGEEAYSHPIWSHKPYCMYKEPPGYCTFTTHSFRNGSGLSIIASRAAAKAASALFPAAHSAPIYSPSLYTVRDMPGKGKGLVATRPIPKGETILLDSPRLIASHQFPSRVHPPQGRKLFHQAIAQLPPADRALVLGLDASLGGAHVEDVLKTNAFACQIDDAGTGDGYMCLFPAVSRINHACMPNAHARFVPASLLMEVKAQRAIGAGEEITISYGKLELLRAERQELYQRGWGFRCTCELCMRGEGEVRESDGRRGRFAELRGRLGALTEGGFDAERVIGWEMELLEISHEEGLEVVMAEDLERLAYVYAGLGRLDEARNWASKARDNLLRWTVVDGGPDLDIKRVEELLRELG
ncbi:SET domain-containing protein [Corynespora cassiicola Philippines]|uniref:SET domain-containing protein n=1 Tax=Corynespora cassiicola Philippines TaxID=1448308 RepID=A0A2T2NA44_CORCC|nr:SET domain-containing protein [Corynespora cassiicola Philippines]